MVRNAESIECSKEWCLLTFDMTFNLTAILQRFPTCNSMSLAPVAQNAAGAVHNAAVLLARDGDFGGYTGPIIGLLTIAVIIAVLTPPIKE